MRVTSARRPPPPPGPRISRWPGPPDPGSVPRRPDPPLDAGRVRHEQVVAHELDPITQPAGELCPAVPVVLGQTVLERDDRVTARPVRPQIDQLAGVERPALPGKG